MFISKRDKAVRDWKNSRKLCFMNLSIKGLYVSKKNTILCLKVRNKNITYTTSEEEKMFT